MDDYLLDEYEENYDFGTDEEDYDESLEDLDYMSEDSADSLKESMSDYDVEIAGSLDGEFDARYGAPIYSQYGTSVNPDDLTDDQKDLYDDAYYNGYNFTK